MQSNDKHELEYRWTFWIDKSSKDRDKYQESLHNLVTVDSVEDFWVCWTAIMNHKNLPPQHTLCMFKEGIKPTWEDPANRDGGRWSIYVPPQIFAYAKRIVNCIFLSVIGCQVEPTEKICGVAVRKRDYGITVDIWSKSLSQEPDLAKEVSQKFDAVLTTELGALIPEDNPIHPTTYIPHPDNAPQLVQSPTMSYGKRRYYSSSSSSSSYSYQNRTIYRSYHNTQQQQQQQAHAPTQQQHPALTQTVVPSPPIVLGPKSISIKNSNNNGLGGGAGQAQTQSKEPAWMAHKKSASESVAEVRSRGAEEALPILLRRGFDIPASAYFDIAQNKMSSEAAKKGGPKKRASIGGGAGAPQRFVLDHRRAYSLDKSSEDAYSKYVKAKQGAAKISFEGLAFYTPPRASSPDERPLAFIAPECSNLPIPGIPSGSSVQSSAIIEISPSSSSSSSLSLPFSSSSSSSSTISGSAIGNTFTGGFSGVGIPGIPGMDVCGNSTDNSTVCGCDDNADRNDWLKVPATKKHTQRHRSSGLCVATDIIEDGNEEEKEEEEDKDDEETEESGEEKSESDIETINEKCDTGESVGSVHPSVYSSSPPLYSPKRNKLDDTTSAPSSNSSNKNNEEKETNKVDAFYSQVKVVKKRKKGTEAAATKLTPEVTQNIKPSKVISPLKYHVLYATMIISIALAFLAAALFILLFSAYVIIN